MLPAQQPLMIDAAGHLAGAIVFGIFLVLALRGRSGQWSEQSLLSVASAGLAFLWNAGSFTSLVLPSGPIRWTVDAFRFCALSFLPAVLLPLSLNRKFRGLAVAGYCISAGASAMHLLEDLRPPLNLHQSALWLITVGFGALTAIYALGILMVSQPEPVKDG